VFIVFIYLLIVIVWSTTPLAILWSQDSFTSTQALFWRMFLAWIAIAAYLGFKRDLPSINLAFLTFCLISGGGLFSAMALIYLAAPHINSGLVAILHGLMPVFSAMFVLLILGIRISTQQWSALLISLSGMLILFWAEMSLQTTLWALFAVLLAVSIHALTAVLVKKKGVQVSVPHQLLGSLTVVTLATGAWLLIGSDTFIPQDLTLRSLYSITYLAYIGSILGFLSYYSLLKKVSPVTVGTITLVTPLSSMLVGQLFNAESFSGGTIAGTLILLLGLSGYLFSSKRSAA
jgi:drug/metabolite transporter (DMT)-like permease